MSTVKGQAQIPAFVSHVSEDGTRYEAVETHLEEVAALASEFASAFDSSEWGRCVGLFHDLGKFSHEFQNRILRGGYKVDHSTAGAKELFEAGLGCLSYCVAGHHGGLPDGGHDGDVGGTLSGRLRKAQTGKIADYSVWTKRLDARPTDTQFQTCGLNLSWLDMYSNDPRHRNEEAMFAVSFLIRMLFSCLVDADYLCTERFRHGTGRDLKYDDLEVLRDQFELKLSEFYPPVGKLNQYRCSVLDDCLSASKLEPGVFKLTVPTGGGKTLAAMRFALNHAYRHHRWMRRIIVAEPYTSIIEQNAQVYREKLGELGDKNVLEHHSNFDFDDLGERGERLRLASENWDVPVVVTTNVQLFESLYSNKTSQCRKLHNIAGSVIVLDEAQVIPSDYLEPCVHALVELVRSYHCSVVLCTATQPALDELFQDEGITPREIARDPRGMSEVLSRVSYVNIGMKTNQEIADELVRHNQVLCIVNNKRQARDLFRLVEASPEVRDGTFHLSTSMCPVHRTRVIEAIRMLLKSDGSCRVIATSVVEAGVDLDFPVVYRALAGVDSIVQAAGRCNRENTLPKEDSLVSVFEPSEDEGYRMPPEVKSCAEIARPLIKDAEEPGKPALGSFDMVGTYFARLIGYKTRAGVESGLDKHKVVESFSNVVGIHCGDMSAASFPFKTVSEEFNLIPGGQAQIVIPSIADAGDVAALEGGWATMSTIRRLSRCSVSVYQGELKALGESGAIHAVEGLEDVYVLGDRTRYSEKLGLCPEEGGGAAIML